MKRPINGSWLDYTKIVPFEENAARGGFVGFGFIIQTVVFTGAAARGLRFVAPASRTSQTARMKHDLAEKWGERLLVLQAQLERESTGAMAWHWRGEAKVLRFLLRRYGETELPVERPAPELSALERSLLRLSLLIPNVKTKHPRPSPRDRTAMLNRIKRAGDEARKSDDADDSWLADLGLWLEKENEKARRNALQLRQREEQWERRQRELFWEKRERRR